MASLTLHISDPPPLTADDDGTVRVGGTQVTLDTVVGTYQQGAPAEAICRKFPGISAADVHAVIAYYLRHADEVDSYLERREAEAAQIRSQVESLCPPDEFRAKIRARRATDP
jgi:uncharacterized protein (DUF433 family)